MQNRVSALLDHFCSQIVGVKRQDLNLSDYINKYIPECKGDLLDYIYRSGYQDGQNQAQHKTA